MTVGPGVGRRTAPARLAGGLIFLAASLPLPAAGTLAPFRASWTGTLESWRLPAGESMGVVGGRLQLEVADRWRLGPAAYGAVSGQRGGFITLGGEIERSWALGRGQSIEAAWFLGAGGGRGGRELSGGGLMWRAHLSWSVALTPDDRIGLGISHVRFPSEGTIRSTQPFLRYEHRFSTPLRPIGWREPAAWWPGVDWGEHTAAVRLRGMRPRARSLRTDAKPSTSFQTIGVEWRGAFSRGGGFWTLAADGAWGGDSAGYMQILGGGGWRWPLGERAEAAAHLALGPAGGGAVDTGGGLLAEVGAVLQYRLRSDLWTSLGWVRHASLGGRYTADGVSLGLHYRWGESNPGASGEAAGRWDRYPLRVRWLQQRLSGSRPDWRCCDPQTDVDLLGVSVDRLWGNEEDRWRPFLTGKGLAAYHGRAGAYMQGLIGGGVKWSFDRLWSLEVEGSVGAAGGGGLGTGGGLVGQWNAALVWQATPAWSFSVGVGRLRALDGPLSARVIGLEVGYRLDGWRHRR